MGVAAHLETERTERLARGCIGGSNSAERFDSASRKAIHGAAWIATPDAES